MATKQDLEKDEDERSEDEESTGGEDSSGSSAESSGSNDSDAEGPGEDAGEAAARAKITRATETSQPDGAELKDGEAAAPTQLGTRRFVYAAYMGGAIGVAFLLSKVVDAAWAKLATYKPQVGEPHDEYVFLISGAIGAAAAFYYWKRTRARQLAEEVASELSKVTWPNKEEVTNSTAVVIVTTMFATVFFALMDRFWGFVTSLVYGT